MKIYIFLLAIAATLFSCKENQDDPKDSGSSELIITASSSGYSDAASNRSPEYSDPFELKDVIITGDSIKITVAYSGGCKKHTFEIIWNETLTVTTPPQTGLIILHDANGDMCEAYITETIAFCISDLSDTFSFDTLYVGILNGWSPSDSISSGGWDPADTTGYDNGSYEIDFPESDVCQVSVTALNAICGTGLYNNLWFALDDSISTGFENYYFHKYLQPVAIETSLSGFKPVSGKRYKIGARIQNEHDYMNIPVCLAYSGPSVPVRIMCIEELK